LVLVGGVSAALVAAAVVLLVPERPSALTFQVGGSAGLLKTWLAAPAASPLELKFSEGTQVRLEAAARGRVVDIDARGASLALESGRLHADVVHKQDSAWKVVAGPYTVSVRGTVFDVNWDPHSEQLSVSVSRGVVAVQEAGTATEQTVRARQTLRATATGHRVELLNLDSGVGSPSADPALSAAAPDGTETSSEHAGGAPDVVPASAASSAKAPQFKTETGRGPAWREYAKRGALREAFASADAVGFANICSNASAAELLLLGDGARLSGKPEQADLAFLTLRRQYPSDPRRAAAAFSLGKVAFDQRRAYQQAAEWFSTSLREEPRGPLAREASGRLIEALRRTGNAAGAQSVARDYLAHYPDGPHADLARSVLH
jgi:TolA-binding protein